MKDITTRYTNGEVTVVWKPSLCTHSKHCWKELSSVFDPTQRPWVNIQGATTDEIIKQVDRCPSGALSYLLNKAEVPVKYVVQEQTKIEVTPAGPLVVFGSIEVKDKDGGVTQKENKTSFCRCGHSANKPYCDGTHRSVGFEG